MNPEDIVAEIRVAVKTAFDKMELLNSIGADEMDIHDWQRLERIVLENLYRELTRRFGMEEEK